MFLTTPLTACTSMTAHTGEHFEMSGTPDGIRAFSDTLIGSMKTAKEKDNAPNQYFKARNTFEQNVTARQAQPGFFQKLFNTQGS